MNSQKRAKLNKVLLIIAILLIIMAIIVTVIYFVWQSEEEETYEDKVTANNYFAEITIDLEEKTVERDEEETTLVNEFGVTEEEETTILSSEEELRNFFMDSTFEVQVKDGVAHITNDYQTKKLIVEASDTANLTFKEDYIEEALEIQDGVFILTFDTQKRAKDAYENLSTLEGITKVTNDQVSLISTINDESQTVYGETEEEEDTDYKVYGVSAMGLDNFQNIINENGNPSDIVVATIGYGACIDNSYFDGRITENYYNFMEDSTNVYETIAQGSRILEVIAESTTDNVKIMPLMVINSEGYTSTSVIIEAIAYAVENSDVIFYEFINTEDYMIDLVLKNAFKEDVPVCTITATTEDEDSDSDSDEDINYPANNSTTIAVSSIDKSETLANYSGTGNYIDFTAFSTDVEEIFNSSSTVSKWSGVSYSSAEIVSAIALIKTYHKDYTILEVYNELRNYCVDLGDEGKDEKYGYGYPNFSGLTISDLDSEVPVFEEIIYSDEDWEKEKTIQIKANDNIRIYGWAITTSDETPSEWNELEEVTSTIDVTGTVDENGTYYVWITDSAGNTANQTIEISKVDNTAPEISYAIDDSTQDSEDYVTISFTATDDGVGLNDTPYSLDGENWGADSNQLKVTENGRYTVYARDAVGNVSEKEIVVSTFPQEGTATYEEGYLIKSIVVSTDWTNNTNNEVIITFNNSITIAGWAITTTNTVPNTFTSVSTSTDSSDTSTTNSTTNSTSNTTTNETTNTTSSSSSSSRSYVSISVSLDADTEYYAWLKDEDGNTYSQVFTISKVEI